MPRSTGNTTSFSWHSRPIGSETAGTMIATSYHWHGPGEITVDRINPTALLRPSPDLRNSRMRALLKSHIRASQSAAMLITLTSWILNYTWRYAVPSRTQREHVHLRPQLPNTCATICYPWTKVHTLVQAIQRLRHSLWIASRITDLSTWWRPTMRRTVHQWATHMRTMSMQGVTLSQMAMPLCRLLTRMLRHIMITTLLGYGHIKCPRTGNDAAHTSTKCNCIGDTSFRWSTWLQATPGYP